jgi:FkbH-like protein
MSERCLLVSDFTVAGLAALLEDDETPPAVAAGVAPAGPVARTLLDLAAENQRFDALVVWTRPEAVVPAFGDVLAFRPVAPDKLMGQVDEFAGVVKEAARHVGCVLIPSWVVSPAHRGLGLLDLRPGQGVADALRRMNLRLCDALADAPSVFVLDASRWLAAAGPSAVNPRLWFMGKVPFAAPVFAEAARDVKAALAALRGQARRLVVLDLDGTLWGGTVGESGWPGLRLGGHDPLGEAFVAFQSALQALTRRGVLLAIASKNDEAVALEAIDRHPEMRLRRDDFAGWRIGWGDKAEAVAALAEELRLGLSSVVFVDDSPLERGRVRETLPEVLVPEWPAVPLLYTDALRGLRCFDVPALTAEDADRARMYAEERQRREERGAGEMDLESWLATLGVEVESEELGERNLPRSVQLLNKTNQFNLATRRLSAEELVAWAREGNRVWAFRVRDRFGDSGLSGLASLALQGSRAVIVDFLLSCRVMGRRVEESMLWWLVRCARSAGAREVAATYRPTTRNRPCLEFWQRSGFAREGGDCFTWDPRAEYPMPGTVRFVAP